MADFEKWQKFVTPIGILRYHDLFVPRAWKAKPTDADKEPTYSATLIFDLKTMSDKDKALYRELKTYAQAAGNEMFPPKRDAKGVPIPNTDFASMVRIKALKWPFRDSLEKAGVAGFDEGTEFIAARAKKERHLDLVGPKNGQELEERDVYPGCWGRLVVGPYAYDQGGGRGVTLGLYGFQKIRDGEPLVAGMGSCASMFGEVESEDFIGASEDPLGIL